MQVPFVSVVGGGRLETRRRVESLGVEVVIVVEFLFLGFSGSFNF